MSAVFRNSCLSQSGVINDAKVSDRQRRSCAPCRNIIGCKIVVLAMSFSVFAFGLVGCNSRWDLSLFLIMILCYLAPATRYSSQFTFQVFFPKRFSASLFREIVIYSPVKLRFSIKLIATELFSAPFNSWMAISQHTKNPPKSVRWKIRKIGNKDF